MHILRLQAIQECGTLCDLVSVKRGERKLTQSEQPTKVLAVDSVAKMAAAILLSILTGISGWLLLTVVNHSERLTKNETRIESYDAHHSQVLDHLKIITNQQGQILQNQARFETEIKHLKESMK